MKRITGWESYSVTEDGRVWSHARNRFKATQIDRGGYEVITLSQKGVRRAVNIHRLVAETYLLNPENHRVVCHIDNNPLNNTVDNLRWGTQSENIEQAYREGRKTAGHFAGRTHTEETKKRISDTMRRLKSS